MTTDRPALPDVTIFSDGACEGNPGPGGYGVILRTAGDEQEFFGGDAATTNNRMELMGVIVGLRELTAPCRVRLVTDSQYVVKGMTEWLPNWLRRNWRKPDGKPVMNRDLWQALLEAAEPHEVTWEWVRGHAGHAENERCDELARRGAAAARAGSLP